MTTTDALLALLEESELAADDELGALLADLQALGAGPAPVPGPELAALLVADGRPRRLHRRGAVVGALVVLSLGTGVTAAAASPDVRDGAEGAVAAVVHVLRPPAVAEHPARTQTPAGAPAARVPVSSEPEASTSKRGTVPAVTPGHSSRSGDDRHASGAGDSAGRGNGRDSSGSSGSHDEAGSGSRSHDATSSGSGSSSGSGHDTDHGSSSGSTGDSVQGGTGSSGSGGHDDTAESGSHRGSGDGSGGGDSGRDDSGGDD